MIPGYKAFPCFNMVQFEGMCLIHLPDLLLGNFPGKVKVSFLVSARPVRAGWRTGGWTGGRSGRVGGSFGEGWLSESHETTNLNRF